MSKADVPKDRNPTWPGDGHWKPSSFYGASSRLGPAGGETGQEGRGQDQVLPAEGGNLSGGPDFEKRKQDTGC